MQARYNPDIMSAPADPVETFIARWQDAIGLEPAVAGRAFVPAPATSVPAAAQVVQPSPASPPEQIAALTAVLSSAQQSEAQLAARFAGRGRWKSRLPELLATLATPDRVRRLDDGRWLG